MSTPLISWSQVAHTTGATYSDMEEYWENQNIVLAELLSKVNDGIYTKEEIDDLLSDKADSNHDHDETYYTKTESDEIYYTKTQLEEMAETWTFTLEDDTTVTKKVVVLP